MDGWMVTQHELYDGCIPVNDEYTYHIHARFVEADNLSKINKIQMEKDPRSINNLDSCDT